MTTLNTRTSDGICTVTLDRSDALNAFNQRMFDDLADAFLATADDADVRVLLLTGAGRAFSAGADLQEMGRSDHQPRHGLAGLLDAIVEYPKPFLLAVNGLGVGIGATLCGLADVAFMAESARLKCPFSSLGLTAEVGSTFTFPKLMGRQRATWFLLSSEWMSAQDCLAAGLVMDVVPDAQLMTHANEHARTLAQMPLESLITTKGLIMAPLKDQLKASIRAENAALERLRGAPANLEAVTAFRDKRAPDFNGL